MPRSNSNEQCNSEREPENSPSTVRVDTLRPGMRIARAMCDQRGHLLLAAGGQVTERFLKELSTRKIQSVRLASSTCGSSQDAYARVDALLSQEMLKRPRLNYKGGVRYSRLSVDDLLNEVQIGLGRFGELTRLIAEACDSLMANKNTAGDAIFSAVRGLADMLSLDGDLLTTIVGTRKACSEDYLHDHAVNCAMVSMTLASRYGLRPRQIVEFGVGAMLADAGMLRVPDAIRLSGQPLSEHEIVEIQKHPLHTINMLDNLSGVPDIAKIVAYQSHERGDGSGYPRQQKTSAIHPYAKILAVADSYTAMIEERPFRAAHSPHDAVRQLLKEGGRGRYDRSVLLVFLDSVSAFPIGGFVALKKGIIGRVIRANPGAHTRPVVLEVDQAGESTGWAIDLSREKNLRVVAAAAALDRLSYVEQCPV